MDFASSQMATAIDHRSDTRVADTELDHVKTTSAIPLTLRENLGLGERMARALSEKQTLEFSQSVLVFFFSSLVKSCFFGGPAEI